MQRHAPACKNHANLNVEMRTWCSYYLGFHFILHILLLPLLLNDSCVVFLSLSVTHDTTKWIPVNPEEYQVSIQLTETLLTLMPGPISSQYT